jgi:hypothetical protein
LILAVPSLIEKIQNPGQPQPGTSVGDQDSCLFRGKGNAHEKKDNAAAKGGKLLADDSSAALKRMFPVVADLDSCIRD